MHCWFSIYIVFTMHRYNVNFLIVEIKFPHRLTWDFNIFQRDTCSARIPFRIICFCYLNFRARLQESWPKVWNLSKIISWTGSYRSKDFSIFRKKMHFETMINFREHLTNFVIFFFFFSVWPVAIFCKFFPPKNRWITRFFSVTDRQISLLLIWTRSISTFSDNHRFTILISNADL